MICGADIPVCVLRIAGFQPALSVPQASSLPLVGRYRRDRRYVASIRPLFSDLCSLERNDEIM
jgi:hypothetical protein